MLLSVGLEDHPGYLGFTSAGVVAIHADWPVYPVEHGWLVALASLGSFPDGTAFSPLDDIDRCLLFLAGNVIADKADPSSRRTSTSRCGTKTSSSSFARPRAAGCRRNRAGARAQPSPRDRDRWSQAPPRTREREGAETQGRLEIETEHVEELKRQLVLTKKRVDELRREIERRRPVTSWPEDAPPLLEKVVVVLPDEGLRLMDLPSWDTYDDEEESWGLRPAKRDVDHDCSWVADARRGASTSVRAPSGTDAASQPNPCCGALRHRRPRDVGGLGGCHAGGQQCRQQVRKRPVRGVHVPVPRVVRALQAASARCPVDAQPGMSRPRGDRTPGCLLTTAGRVAAHRLWPVGHGGIRMGEAVVGIRQEHSGEFTDVDARAADCWRLASLR